MDRFLKRRTSNAEPAMPSGAASVHEAIANNPEDNRPQKIPAQHGVSKCPKGFKCCSRCRQNKDETKGYMVGKDKNTFYCYECHRIEARIQRLTKGHQISKMWKDMSAEEKVAFRAEHSALEGAALKDQLTTTMLQKVKQEDVSFAGSLGEYLPLSVYAQRGYDKQYLKHIEATASMRLDGTIKTYALRVHREGDERRMTEIKITMWKPIVEKEKDDGASSSEEEDDDDDSSSSDGSEQKPRNSKQKKKSKMDAKAKRQKKKQEAKRKKELKVANKMCDKIAPIESQLQQCKERLTQDVKNCLPPYQTMDMEQHLTIMQEQKQKWSLVVKGTSNIKAEGLEEEDTLTKIGQAKTAAAAFKTTLNGAETIVARRAAGDDENPKKSKKKRKD